MPDVADVPRARLSFGLATKMALDRLLPDRGRSRCGFVSVRDRSRIATGLGAALDSTPSAASSTRQRLSPGRRCSSRPRCERRRRAGSLPAPDVRGRVRPHEGEPGASVARAGAATHGHAWLLRHPATAPPVARLRARIPHGSARRLPGLPAAWFHWLGLNVAFPVLRSTQAPPDGDPHGDGFLSGDYLDTIHLQAQAIWDIRRLLGSAPRTADRRLRDLARRLHRDAARGPFEPDLACAIAGIPATDYVGLTRGPAGLAAARWRSMRREPRDRVERLVASSRPSPSHRRSPGTGASYAATADRLVRPRPCGALWSTGIARGSVVRGQPHSVRLGDLCAAPHRCARPRRHGLTRTAECWASRRHTSPSLHPRRRDCNAWWLWYLSMRPTIRSFVDVDLPTSRRHRSSSRTSARRDARAPPPKSSTPASPPSLKDRG